MYNELIKNLRHDSASALQNCEFDFVHGWMAEAADAIEELQKQLQEEKVDNVNLTGWLAEKHRRLDDAEIENIKLKEEFAKYRGRHRWIPVTERLPDYPGRFMCYYEVNDCGEIGHCIDWGRYDQDDGWYVSGVTHWMPLPQPPESGEV